MNRYTIDNPMDLSIESDDGEFVFYDEAQAEIDRLKAENAELLVALEDLLSEHEALTASAFVVHEKARDLIDKTRSGS